MRHNCQADWSEILEPAAEDVRSGRSEFCRGLCCIPPRNRQPERRQWSSCRIRRAFSRAGFTVVSSTRACTAWLSTASGSCHTGRLHSELLMTCGSPGGRPGTSSPAATRADCSNRPNCNDLRQSGAVPGVIESPDSDCQHSGISLRRRKCPTGHRTERCRIERKPGGTLRPVGNGDELLNL